MTLVCESAQLCAECWGLKEVDVLVSVLSRCTEQLGKACAKEHGQFQAARKRQQDGMGTRNAPPYPWWPQPTSLIDWGTGFL